MRSSFFRSSPVKGCLPVSCGAHSITCCICTFRANCCTGCTEGSPRRQQGGRRPTSRCFSIRRLSNTWPSAVQTGSSGTPPETAPNQRTARHFAQGHRLCLARANVHEPQPPACAARCTGRERACPSCCNKAVSIEPAAHALTLSCKRTHLRRTLCAPPQTVWQSPQDPTAPAAFGRSSLVYSIAVSCWNLSDWLGGRLTRSAICQMADLSKMSWELALPAAAPV